MVRAYLHAVGLAAPTARVRLVRSGRRELARAPFAATRHGTTSACPTSSGGGGPDVSDETSDNRWEQRLSPLIVKGGVLPAPSVLLRHAGELNLTPQELVLCLYILDKKWGPDWPYVSMLQAADELGRHKNKVYAWKQSLIRKGYLVATARTVHGIGRRADYCDLSGLYAALERLVLAEAVEQARGDLPVPHFEIGGLSTVSTGRSTLLGAPRSTENGVAAGPQIGVPRGTARGARRGTSTGARNRGQREEIGE